MPKRRGTKKQQKKQHKSPEMSGIRIITVTKGNVNEANQYLSNGQAMVEFYHPNCGHCQTLKPEWEKMCFELKKNYQGKAVIAAVDCSDQEMLQNLQVEQNFRGFPSIFHMSNGRQLQEYEGDRTKDALLTFAKSRLPISLTQQRLQPATQLFFSPTRTTHTRKRSNTAGRRKYRTFAQALRSAINKSRKMRKKGTKRRQSGKKGTKKRRQSRKKGTKTTKNK